MIARSPAALLFAAVALYAGLAVHAMRGHSATFDEGTHLPAGYTHLALGDHRLNPEQPPLVKLLAAAPLLLAPPTLLTDDPAWVTARQWEFGRRFLYRWNDGERLLFLGRLPIVALGAALIVSVFLWTRCRFGATAGAVALGLAALAPDVLAHGSLVTTDLALALFFLLAVVALDSLTRRATPLRLLALGSAVGAALATKFSALILGPVLGVLAGVALVGTRPTWARAWRLALLLGAAAALALLVVWASYGFRREISPDPGAAAAARVSLEEPRAKAWERAVVLAAGSGILPEDYARGVLFVATHSEARPTFLLGRLSDEGFRLYFVVTFLLKTPLPLLVLVGFAVARAPRLPRREAAFVWLPVLVYAAFAVTRGLQIGHRHLLPIYPFLFAAAGEAGARLARWRPAGRVILGVLLGWYAVGTLRVHPHHLAYFNELGGGPRNGFRLLVDSNLDWGQDLKRLREWMDERGVRRIKLSYFGSADPRYYGIDAEMLPGYTAPHASHVTREIQRGDLVAISATNLQGVYLDPADRSLMERFRRLEPVGRVGYSILVYRADFAWP